MQETSFYCRPDDVLCNCTAFEDGPEIFVQGICKEGFRTPVLLLRYLDTDRRVNSEQSRTAIKKGA
jgi:hypothetical protein